MSFKRSRAPLVEQLCQDQNCDGYGKSLGKGWCVACVISIDPEKAHKKSCSRSSTSIKLTGNLSAHKVQSPIDWLVDACVESQLISPETVKKFQTSASVIENWDVSVKYGFDERHKTGGRITDATFWHQVVSKTSHRPLMFMDFGSEFFFQGFMCALSGDFEHVAGIELNSDAFNKSVKVAKCLMSRAEKEGNFLSSIELLCGDFLVHENIISILKSTTVVYANNVLFSESNNAAMIDMWKEHLPAGATMVVFNDQAILNTRLSRSNRATQDDVYWAEKKCTLQTKVSWQPSHAMDVSLWRTKPQFVAPAASPSLVDLVAPDALPVAQAAVAITRVAQRIAQPPSVHANAPQCELVVGVPASKALKIGNKCRVELTDNTNIFTVVSTVKSLVKNSTNHVTHYLVALGAPYQGNEFFLEADDTVVALPERSNKQRRVSGGIVAETQQPTAAANQVTSANEMKEAEFQPPAAVQTQPPAAAANQVTSANEMEEAEFQPPAAVQTQPPAAAANQVTSANEMEEAEFQPPAAVQTQPPTTLLVNRAPAPAPVGAFNSDDEDREAVGEALQPMERFVLGAHGDTPPVASQVTSANEMEEVELPQTAADQNTSACEIQQAGTAAALEHPALCSLQSNPAVPSPSQTEQPPTAPLARVVLTEAAALLMLQMHNGEREILQPLDALEVSDLVSQVQAASLERFFYPLLRSVAFTSLEVSRHMPGADGFPKLEEALACLRCIPRLRTAALAAERGVSAAAQVASASEIQQAESQPPAAVVQTAPDVAQNAETQPPPPSSRHVPTPRPFSQRQQPPYLVLTDSAARLMLQTIEGEREIAQPLEEPYISELVALLKADAAAHFDCTLPTRLAINALEVARLKYSIETNGRPLWGRPLLDNAISCLRVRDSSEQHRDSLRNHLDTSMFTLGPGGNGFGENGAIFGNAAPARYLHLPIRHNTTPVNWHNHSDNLPVSSLVVPSALLV
jgi:hypothetical protein